MLLANFMSVLAIVPIACAQMQFPFAPEGTLEPKDKVNVTLYVMSRCSDARLCEDVFEEVSCTIACFIPERGVERNS